MSTRGCEPLLEAPVASQGASAVKASAAEVLRRLAARRQTAARPRPSRMAVHGPGRARASQAFWRGQGAVSHAQADSAADRGVEK